MFVQVNICLVHLLLILIQVQSVLLPMSVIFGSKFKRMRNNCNCIKLKYSGYCKAYYQPLKKTLHYAYEMYGFHMILSINSSYLPK
jgi:hypothetical protein